MSRVAWTHTTHKYKQPRYENKDFYFRKVRQPTTAGTAGTTKLRSEK